LFDDDWNEASDDVLMVHKNARSFVVCRSLHRTEAARFKRRGKKGRGRRNMVKTILSARFVTPRRGRMRQIARRRTSRRPR
jgi:hypothetical protein